MLSRLIICAFVFSTFGCAVKQHTALPALRAKPLSLPTESAPLIANPDQRLTEVRLGTPSGLGTGTRRVDAANAAAETETTQNEKPRLAFSNR